MAKVWGYWKCPSCGSVLRGDIRECSNCGRPISKDVKYFVDKNKALEYVPTEKGSDKANWVCDFCGSQNRSESRICESCGAGRDNTTVDYFGRVTEKSYDIDNNILSDKDVVVDNKLDNNTERVERKENSAEYRNLVIKEQTDKSNKNFNLFERCKSFTKTHKILAISSLVTCIVLLCLWLFIPITRTSIITEFEWNRSIGIERYTECHENDWYLPNGAELEYTRQEIHHYDKVFDHYDEWYEEVPYEVLDGYDIDYRDLGNGQFEEIRVPRYRTEYRQEKHTEAIYRDEPVYQTKYYYEIGRWQEYDSVYTCGFDKEPFWGECDLASSVSNPIYGDRKQGGRKENYYAVFKDDKGNKQKTDYRYEEWVKLEVGQEITYLTFRFSHKPL